MSTNNSTFGREGERLAKNFLEKKGFKVLECNWRYKHLEADIIAEEGNILVIIEVKTRRSNYFGEPEENVHQQKRNNLIELANAYIDSKNLHHEVRFDVVSVIKSANYSKVKHIENAFSAFE